MKSHSLVGQIMPLITLPVMRFCDWDIADNFINDAVGRAESSALGVLTATLTVLDLVFIRATGMHGSMKHKVDIWIKEVPFLYSQFSNYICTLKTEVAFTVTIQNHFWTCMKYCSVLITSHSKIFLAT